MKGNIKQLTTACLSGCMLVALLIAANPVHAQFFDETLEQDELFVEDENLFFEARDDETSQEQDFTEGNTFVEESLLPADERGISESGRRFQLTLAGERDDLPINIAWGAGTGLLIGGWFALINEGDNRDTQRSIGLGIVLGITMGALVGTRAFFNPDAPRAADAVENPPATSPTFSPVVSLQPDHPKIGFRLTF